ncbi:MAG TPA: zf-HC2 domain-containing protein [Candidatus Baltobacteraceae bacterium]|jgi:anti-sigma factor RsiW
MMQHLTNPQLIDYIHGALAPEEDASVHAHLESCALCREEYATEVALTELLRKQAALEERDMPSTVKAAIWQQIRDARPSPATRILAWLRPAIAIPVAAAIVLAAYFGLHSQQASAAPTIDAAYLLQDHAAMNSTVPFGDRSGADAAELQSGSSGSADETAVNVQPAIYTADAGR